MNGLGWSTLRRIHGGHAALQPVQIGGRKRLRSRLLHGRGLLDYFVVSWLFYLSFKSTPDVAPHGHSVDVRIMPMGYIRSRKYRKFITRNHKVDGILVHPNPQSELFRNICGDFHYLILSSVSRNSRKFNLSDHQGIQVIFNQYWAKSRSQSCMF